MYLGSRLQSKAHHPKAKTLFNDPSLKEKLRHRAIVRQLAQ